MRYKHYLDDNTCDYILPPFQAKSILERQWGDGDSSAAVIDKTMITGKVQRQRYWKQGGKRNKINKTIQSSSGARTSARCGGGGSGSGGMVRYMQYLDDNTCDYSFPPFQAKSILGRQWGDGDSSGAGMDTTMMTTMAMAAIAAGRW